MIVSIVRCRVGSIGGTFYIVVFVAVVVFVDGFLISDFSTPLVNYLISVGIATYHPYEYFLDNSGHWGFHPLVVCNKITNVYIEEVLPALIFLSIGP